MMNNRSKNKYIALCLMAAGSTISASLYAKALSGQETLPSQETSSSQEASPSQETSSSSEASSCQTETILLAGVMLQDNEPEAAVDNNQPGAQIQIKDRAREQMVEGYKTGRNGRASTYVHGEIIEDKKGYVSGYLYEKRGRKTYVYGHKNGTQEMLLQSSDKKDSNDRNYQAKGSEANMGEVVHDEEKNDYLLNQQYK